MPVMNSAIVIDSGSARNPTFTSRPPTWSQSNRSYTWLRWCASSPISAPNTTRVARKAPPHAAVASHPAAGSPRRRPSTTSTQNPASGSAGTSQTRSSVSNRSALQHVDVVGGGGGQLAEQSDDDAQAHHDLGGRHHQDE